MSFSKIVVTTACALTMVLAGPALAKKKPAIGGKGKGVYCEQGGQNAYFPAAQFPAKVRNKLVKGRKVRFNYPGYGMIFCTVY